MHVRSHPHPLMQIPVSMTLWRQLLAASVTDGHIREDWEVAADAIEEWMRRHAPDGLPNKPFIAGYQWKRVFLPDGTLLRTVFDGKNYHAMVEGDHILYQDKAVSPSGFVNAVGGMRRNAWRCTWIRFPDSDEWKLADTLRTRERPCPARKPASTMGPAMPIPMPIPIPTPTPTHLADRRVQVTAVAAASAAPCAQAAIATGANPDTDTAASPMKNAAANLVDLIPALEAIAAHTMDAVHAVHAMDAVQAVQAINPTNPTNQTNPTNATNPTIAAETAKPAASQPPIATHQQQANACDKHSAPPDPQQRASLTLSASQSEPQALSCVQSDSPPHSPRGAERRRGADASLAQLLQYQLLPLLDRICSLSALPIAVHTPPSLGKT